MARKYQIRTATLGAARLPYAVSVPDDYDPERRWPAVLFLHGAGEKGTDGRAQTRVGIGPALNKRKESYPAVVVMPQCPPPTHWAMPEATKIAIKTLEDAQAAFSIDPGRIALTGISMGGAGVWALAYEFPERFMSLGPVCAWVATPEHRGFDALADFAATVKHIPIWIFHGDADTVIPVDESRIIAEALTSAGADVRYTELAGVGHNSWDTAYQRSNLLDWLIDPRRA